MKRAMVLLAMVILGLSGVVSAAPAPIMKEGDVLPFLEQVIAWQRQVAALETTDSARELLLRDTMVLAANNVLKSSFDLARTQAQIIDKEGSGSGDQDSDHSRLLKAEAGIDQRIADLNGQIASLGQQIKASPQSKRAPLKVQQSDLQDQLKFAEAQHDLITSVLAVFSGMASGSDGGLLGKVNGLASTAMPAEKPAATTVADTSRATEKSDEIQASKGLLAMTEDLFKLWREQDEIAALTDATTDLRKSGKDFQDAARVEIRNAIKQGTAPAASAASEAQGQTQPPAVTESMDDLLSDFKQLSAAVVPLTQVNAWLDASLHTQTQWINTIHGEMKVLVRSLSIRLAILGVILLVPIGLSEVVRRATERYVKDDKRQKQLRSLRRAVLTVVIVIIVILNLVNEIGSIATFAGVITAGLAVAFQNVLLSIVAHFFFYGRYSVRVGDRVSVSGVIGDIAYVGVVRFYMREMEVVDGKLVPTGRIAAFPNSILFQTSAFFKYVDPQQPTMGIQHA
jgi:hypothetical protein